MPTNIEYEAAVADSPTRSPPRLNPSQQAKELSDLMQQQLETDIELKRSRMKKQFSANLAAA